VLYFLFRPQASVYFRGTLPLSQLPRPDDTHVA
jgi:hypothetical protein